MNKTLIKEQYIDRFQTADSLGSDSLFGSLFKSMGLQLIKLGRDKNIKKTIFAIIPENENITLNELREEAYRDKGFVLKDLSEIKPYWSELPVEAKYILKHSVFNIYISASHYGDSELKKGIWKYPGNTARSIISWTNWEIVEER